MISNIFNRKKKKLGLALGSGGARGFAHIGVLMALRELGIKPDIVAGVSSGAIMGAFYATKTLDGCYSWAQGLDRKAAFKLMDFHLIPKGGFVKGERFVNFLESRMGAVKIEDLEKKFVAVATDLVTGEEVWIQDGSLAKAVRASMAFPGLLPSLYHQDRWLVDGGLVNPVPITPCRELGADHVIAVNLNENLVGRRLKDVTKDEVPGVIDVVMSSINIMQDYVTCTRIAEDTPDVCIAPKIDHVGLLDFQHVHDVIDAGQKSVEAVKNELLELKEKL